MHYAQKIIWRLHCCFAVFCGSWSWTTDAASVQDLCTTVRAPDGCGASGAVQLLGKLVVACQLFFSISK
jgi:hypothetical protein